MDISELSEASSGVETWPVSAHMNDKFSEYTGALAQTATEQLKQIEEMERKIFAEWMTLPAMFMIDPFELDVCLGITAEVSSKGGSKRVLQYATRCDTKDGSKRPVGAER